MKVVAVGTILVLAAANIVGVQFGARLMQWLTALKIGALALMASIVRERLRAAAQPGAGGRG